MSSFSSIRSHADEALPAIPQQPARTRLWLGWSSALFAFLQSVCTFMMAMAGLRLIIGVGSLALSANAMTFIDHLHANWLRIPMVSLALIGATLNLIAILQIWRLRARPASQWRQAPVPPAKLRMERWQLGLSLLTFALVLVEEALHLKLAHHL